MTPPPAPGTPPLLDAASLRRLLAAQDPARPDVVPVEVSADAARYYAGHLPGAVVLDWFDDLHEPARRGALAREALERVLGGRGIRPGTHVVLHGDTGGVFAGYAFWLLRSYRHARLSLLDGGLRAWVEAGGELVDDEPRLPPVRYTADGPDPALRLTRDELLARYVPASPGAVVLDGRPPALYEGRPGGGAEDLPLLGTRLAGHVPGARNLPVDRLLDPGTGRFLPTDRLAAMAAEHCVRPGASVAVHCVAGEQSGLLWFALHELVGHDDVRLYEGGWSEYGSLLDVPVERS